MLADTLLSSRDLYQDLTAKKQPVFSHNMHEAQKFEVSRDFSISADTLASGGLGEITKIIPLCQIPYQKTWFEVAASDRPELIKSRGRGPEVGRVGILLESVKRDLLVANVFRSDKNGLVTSSIYAMGIDVSRDYTAKRNYFLETTGSSEYSNSLDKRLVDELKESGELKWFDFHRRVFTLRSHYQTERLARAQKNLNKVDLDRFYHDQMSIWDKEMEFWVSVLGLLNSRNIVTVEDGPDQDRLIRRRKKSGKGPLIKYKICRIQKRILINSRKRGETSGDSETTRQHFVRGHYKIRATGIYWWTPFLRGDRNKGMILKSYSISGSEPSEMSGTMRKRVNEVTVNTDHPRD